MKMFHRIAMIILCVGATLCSVPLIQSAGAQVPETMFQAPGFMEIVDGGEVVGDGNSPVTLHVLALNPDGTAMTGLKLRANSSGGTVSGLTEVGGGLYSFTLNPGQVKTPTTVQVSVKGKTDTRMAIGASYALPVRPPLSKGLSVVSNPPKIVLGQDKDATISFTLDGAVGSVGSRDLQVSASAGEVTNLTHLGQGKFTARFVAPKVNYPQLTMITVVDRRNPGNIFGQVVLPMVGKTDYPVRAAPGSTVILRIAEQEYGPVQADETGRAKVPVIVPPGVQFATKIQVLNGVSTQDQLNLRVPETKRIQLFPVPKGMPADGATRVPIRVLVLTPEGQPDVNAGVNFTATGGMVGKAVHEGEGIFLAEFTPKYSNAQIPGEVQVTLRGSSIQTDKEPFTMVPARPESIALKPEPARLAKVAKSARLFLKILGPNGVGMPQRSVDLKMAGATLRGPIQDLRNGDYRADLSTTGQTHVDLVAMTSSKATGNPLRHVFVFSTKDVAPNDGLSTTMIMVVTTDEFGAPVPNVNVKLQLEKGDGSLPSGLSTSMSGVGMVKYTSGRRAELIRIRASAKNNTTATSFLQGPEGLKSPDLSFSGAADIVPILQSWKKSISTLRIEREGAVEQVGVVEVGTGAAGEIASFDVSAQPQTVAPNGNVKLAIKAVDDQGRGVAGKRLELMCSAGVFGGLNDLGGGRYETVLTAPPNASGEIKVSISTESGGASTFLRIPVSANAAGAEGQVGWGQTSGDGASNFSGEDHTAGETEKPKKEKKEKPAGEHPWLRIGAAFAVSSYQYEQRPLVQDGPLLNAIVAVGGDSGGKSAMPVGAALNAKGWLDAVGVPYVGFDAGFSATSWSLTAPEFNNQIAPDTLFAFHFDVAGRYPIKLGGAQIYAGGRLGMQMNDFVYFTGSFEDGQVRYETLMIPSLRVSGELGAEIDRLFVDAAVGYAWAYGSTPFQLHVESRVGVQIIDLLYADVGLNWSKRTLIVEGSTSGAEVGELRDSQLMITMGAGVSF